MPLSLQFVSSAWYSLSITKYYHILPCSGMQSELILYSLSYWHCHHINQKCTGNTWFTWVLGKLSPSNARYGFWLHPAALMKLEKQTVGHVCHKRLLICPFESWWGIGYEWWDLIVILGHAIVQVVSYHPVTMEAQVQTWVSLCGICSGQGVSLGRPPKWSAMAT
jgi:hypothetical protein